MKKIIIITDLDGTLLDPESYSFNAALPALALIKERHIPLAVCSSKTRIEIEHYRGKLENSHPFISENGGAVFIPEGYFPREAQPPIPREDVGDGYRIIRLGAMYRDLRRAVSELRNEGFHIRGFGDMTVEEIAAVTGLNEHEAAMAKMREFDEPFIFRGGPEDHEKLVNAVKRKGFNVTRGIFHHIIGDSDKGKAVEILIGMYRREYGNISTVAIGDSHNDLPMLRRVDLPVIVEKSGDGYDPCFDGEAFERSEGVGPRGWNRAVIKLLSQKYPITR